MGFGRLKEREREREDDKGGRLYELYLHVDSSIFFFLS